MSPDHILIFGTLIKLFFKMSKFETKWFDVKNSGNIVLDFKLMLALDMMVFFLI